MNRRGFLTASAGVAGLLAGCAGGDAETSPTPTETATATPEPTRTPVDAVELPDGVYVGPYDGGMSLQGVRRAGPYEVALLYAAPHRFWLVEGDEVEERPIRPVDDVHLMATVWDAETGVVVPETGLSVEVSRDGDPVSEAVVYPMLSQQMGFHYGGNLVLDGDGEYAVDVTVGGLPIRATGAFDGRFEDPASASFDLSFTEADREGLAFQETENYGSRGALPTREVEGLPSPLSSARIPGRRLDTEQTDDAEVVPTVLTDEAPAGDSYLAIYLRTPFNDLSITAAALSATVRRDGNAITHLEFDRTLDPELGYHYGTALETELRSGDRLVVATETPPQIARHEGYERAFLEMEAVSFTV